MFGLLHVHARKVSMATAALCIGAIPHMAMALPANEIHETFYDGPNYQKVVGTSLFYCNGHHQFTGTVSDYSHYVSYPCSNYKSVPINECLYCPDSDPAGDCIVEQCPIGFFKASHGRLPSSRKPPE